MFRNLVVIIIFILSIPLLLAGLLLTIFNLMLAIAFELLRSVISPNKEWFDKNDQFHMEKAKEGVMTMINALTLKN